MPASHTLTRVVTAAVLVPVVLALVIWAPQVLFTAVVLAVALLALREYLDLAERSALAPLRAFSYIGTGVLVGWSQAAESLDRFVVLPFPGTLAIAVLALAALALAARAPRPLEKALSGGASSTLGILYCGLPMALLADLRRLPAGARWVVYVLVLVWVSDIAAYFVGRAWGRRKFSRRISPGKTWEGAVASVAAALIFGAVYVAYFLPGFPVVWSILTAIAVNVAAQIGDLAESAIKRGAGVKDSSAILPGHGGFLDRIDALLFAIPALWCMLVLVGARRL